LPSLHQLIREIHRRSLWQVLGVYLVGAWLAYQVILGLVEGLQLPAWLPGMAVVLFLIGLPIVLATAMVGEPRANAPPASDGSPSTAAQAGQAGEAATARLPRRRWLRWGTVLPAGVAAFAVLVIAAVVVSGPESGTPVGAGGPDERAGGGALLAVATDPAGAAVRLVGVEEGGTLSEHAVEVGEAPVVADGLQAGEYLVRVELPGHHAASFLVRLEPGAEARLTPRLVRDDGRWGAQVHVPGGVPAVGGDPVGPFLIDRYEVTNGRFSEFVAAGGYADPRIWPDSLSIGGESLPWSEAVGRFVDRTGLPGPRGWSGGIPPQGHSDHPVVGVSWYEASAFARWAGRELPGWSHWWRAALGDSVTSFPWGSETGSVHSRANFGMVGTSPVGSYPLGVSPFGVEDMAGNVREWLIDAPPGVPSHRRLAMGGGWMDPDYMFEHNKVEAFSPDHSSDVIGFRTMIPRPDPGT
jgi:hypothetical protein